MQGDMDNKKQRSDGWTNKVKWHLWTLSIKDLPHTESKETKKITPRCVQATVVLRSCIRSLFLTISLTVPPQKWRKMDSPQNKEAWQDWKDLPFGIFSFKVWVPGCTTPLFEKHFSPTNIFWKLTFPIDKNIFFNEKWRAQIFWRTRNNGGSNKSYI